MNSNPRFVKSLADIDFYKLTMLYFIWTFFSNVPMKFRFKNRTNVPLLQYMSVEQLRDAFEEVRELTFPQHIIDELDSTLFSPEFKRWLTSFRLPEVHVDRDARGKDPIIDVDSTWSSASPWETIIMNVVWSLYREKVMGRYNLSMDDVQASGREQLMKKLRRLADVDPMLLLKFVDFGTRRRFSHEWQKCVLEIILEKFPHLLAGTSNVQLGTELGIPLVGTMAHELDMGAQGIYHDRDDACGYMYSHDRIKQLWWDLFGDKLSIALSDTYGTDYFLRHFNAEQSRNWRGIRQDSGNPITVGERAIAHYKGFGIDPTKKGITFSDGLDTDTMIDLAYYFYGRVNTGFGIGTNLTNDMGIPALKALSMVCKLVWSNGHWTVKLSDNLAKSTGPQNAIDRIVRLTGYDRSAHAYVQTIV